MKVQDIYEAINNFAPFKLAYSWDNVGLLVGNSEREVNKVLITLDVDADVVREAVEKGCDMILSHHPVFYSPINRILTDEETGKMIELLIKNNISLIAAHTNVDVAKGGINDELARIFKLENVEVLEENQIDPECGLGRVGELENEMTFGEFIGYTKDVLGVKGLRAAGKADKKVKTVAVAGGSCSEVIPLAYKKGADVIVTGDMKYHETIDNVNMGINIIDAGHYGTEINVLGLFEKAISHLDVESVRSENKDVFTFVC